MSNRSKRSLFDHLVGESEQLIRHSEAERLGGLKVDDQLELGRGLHRQIRRFLTFQDTVDVAGGAPVLVRVINSLRNQASRKDVKTFGVDSGQFVSGRQCDNQFAIVLGPRA